LGRNRRTAKRNSDRLALLEGGGPMAYSVGWGTEIGVLAHRRNTAREALELAEEHIAVRENAVVTDLVTGEPISIDDLRERAEQEAKEEEKKKKG
jgi:hypothetical protein